MWDWFLARVPAWQKAPPRIEQSAIVESNSDSNPAKPWQDIWSWSSVGWYIAVLVGVWGVLMGTADYELADFFFLISACLFCVKWGHFTHMHRRDRRVLIFACGLLMAALLSSITLRWTSGKALDADRQAKRLSQLDLIPTLQRQAEGIPALKKQVETLTGDVDTKQQTIEGLTKVVIEQNKQIAATAHKELAQTKTDLSGQILKTETSLSTNINQYRTDTTNAVGKLLRPGRTLGDKKPDLVRELKKAGTGKHEYALTLARGNQECLDFANEIESAFIEAGWVAARTRFPFITKDGQKLQMIIKAGSNNLTELTPDQIIVGQAFNAIGIPLNEGGQEGMKNEGPVEIYVGLQ